MRGALLEEPLVHRWHEAIDRFHLSERLSDVLHHVLEDQTSRAQKRQVWEKLLDEDDTAIERIEAEIEAWPRRSRELTRVRSREETHRAAHDSEQGGEQRPGRTPVVRPYRRCGPGVRG